MAAPGRETNSTGHCLRFFLTCLICSFATSDSNSLVNVEFNAMSIGLYLHHIISEATGKRNDCDSQHHSHACTSWRSIFFLIWFSWVRKIWVKTTVFVWGRVLIELINSRNAATEVVAGTSKSHKNALCSTVWQGRKSKLPFLSPNQIHSTRHSFSLAHAVSRSSNFDS